MKRQAIERLLPAIFRQTARPGSPLAALLEVMEELHAPAEAVLGDLESRFDPHRAPDAFVPFLARWVDLDRLFEEPRGGDAFADAVGMGRLRELVAAAAWLSRLRGTATGLRLFLETATGVAGFEIQERVPAPPSPRPPRPFHIRVDVPAAAAEHATLVDKIVRLEKPAYVTYELRFASQ